MDPINTLAQWRIWQLELRALSTIAATILIGGVLIVASIFGADAAAIAYGAVFAALALLILACLANVVKLLIFGPKMDDRLFDPEKWPQDRRF